jgi:hypothetical protein
LDTDLQRFTNTTLRLRYGLMLDIHEFLELEVSAASANDLVYQYIPELAEQVDRPARDPWRDIRDSLSLFDEERRQESLFKLSSIDVSAVHDLQDWELRLSYSGRPVRDDSGAMPRFRFQSVFAIELRWIPISELERTIEVDDGDLTFGP